MPSRQPARTPALLVVKVPEQSKRSAAVPAAGSEASRLRFGEVTVRNRGRLPHWEKDAGLYFITFRLHDSLPHHLLDELEKETGAISVIKTLPKAKAAELRERRQRLVETYLDRGCGTCYLAHGEIAELVSTTLKFRDTHDYRLLAWCVMPNHVHVVARFFPDRSLSSIIHSWKSYSAKEANKLLKRRGSFWQREYYDRLIRNENELSRTLTYVANNPRKAGLKEWRWVEVRGQDALATAGEDAGAT